MQHATHAIEIAQAMALVGVVGGAIAVVIRIAPIVIRVARGICRMD
jgi:hypothetical protein